MENLYGKFKFVWKLVSVIVYSLYVIFKSENKRVNMVLNVETRKLNLKLFYK